MCTNCVSALRLNTRDEGIGSKPKDTIQKRWIRSTTRHLRRFFDEWLRYLASPIRIMKRTCLLMYPNSLFDHRIENNW